MNLIDPNASEELKLEFQEFLRTKIDAIDNQIATLNSQKQGYLNYLNSNIFKTTITLTSTGQDIALYVLNSRQRPISRADIKNAINAFDFSDIDKGKLLNKTSVWLTGEKGKVDAKIRLYNTGTENEEYFALPEWFGADGKIKAEHSLKNNELRKTLDSIQRLRERRTMP